MSVPDVNPEHGRHQEAELPQKVKEILQGIDECSRQFIEVPFSAFPEERKFIRREFRKGERLIGRLSECPKIEPFYGRQMINVIPPIGTPGPCAKILLVAIGLKDDVKTRLLEAIEHISVKCSGITQYAIFYAAWWDEFAWMEHRDSFMKLRANAVLKLVWEKPIVLV